MMIFPLSWPARITLIAIAVVIGLMWFRLQWPDKWRAVMETLKGKKRE